MTSGVPMSAKVATSKQCLWMHKERLVIHNRDMHLDILCNEGVHEEEREGEGEGVVSVSSVGSTACLYKATTTIHHFNFAMKCMQHI